MADEKLQRPQSNDRFANRPEGEGEDTEGHGQLTRQSGDQIPASEGNDRFANRPEGEGEDDDEDTEGHIYRC